MNLKLGLNNKKEVTIDDRHLKNGHIGLIGVSGSGKTVEAHELISQILKSKGTVFALDIHGILADDQIMPWHKQIFDRYRYDINADKEGIPCPMFSPLVREDGTMEDELNLIENLTDIFAGVFLSENATRQKEELRNAVQMVVETDTYNSEGIKALDNMLRYATNTVASAVREKLHAVTARNIFVYGEEFFKWQKLNIFRLSDYSTDTQQVLAEVILEFLWRLANAGVFKTNPVFIFLDEFQNLPSGKGSILVKLLTEGRKFGISLILVTQMIPKSGKSAVMQSLTQCDTILYFKPAADTVCQIAELIDPAEKSRWNCVLNMLKRAEFIATGPLLLDGHTCVDPLKVSAFRQIAITHPNDILHNNKSRKREESTVDKDIDKARGIQAESA